MYAEEDKKRREEVDSRNQAEQLVYQSEKTLGEIGDKLPEDEKTPVKEQIEKVKEALKGTDAAAIKAESEELTKRFYALSEKLYQQTGAAPDGAAGAAGAQGAAGPDANGYYDANYEVVDDDQPKQ